MKKNNVIKKYSKYTSILSLLLMASAPGFSSTLEQEGYYGSIKVLRTFQEARNMDTSSRPGIGSFVAGEDKDNSYNSAIALGYQYGNGWRTEGEYTFNKRSTFTSTSSHFPNSYNNMKVKSERLMLNAYRDYDLTNGFSIYGTAGLGISRVEVGGWQGNPSREYGDNTQSNLTYALGAGVSYSPIEKLTFDLGYRYVDMGNIESAYNNFNNVRGLQDEQMRGRLVSSEFLLGARYVF